MGHGYVFARDVRQPVGFGAGECWWQSLHPGGCPRSLLVIRKKRGLEGWVFDPALFFVCRAGSKIVLPPYWWVANSLAPRCAGKHPPLKLVFTVDFHVGVNYSQYLFVNIDSSYSVGHGSSWLERRACCGYFNQGRRLSPLRRGRDDTQSFAQHARSGSDMFTTSTSPMLGSLSYS